MSKQVDVQAIIAEWRERAAQYSTGPVIHCIPSEDMLAVAAEVERCQRLRKAALTMCAKFLLYDYTCNAADYTDLYFAYEQLSKAAEVSA